MTPIILLGRYRHYKGGRYEVLGVGTVEASSEEVVIYRSLQDNGGYSAGSLWTRPVSVWLETVEVDGVRVPRFKKIDSGMPLELKDVFWLSLFPFTIFILNLVVESLAPLWSARVQSDLYLHLAGGGAIAFSTRYALRLLEQNGVVRIKNNLLKLLCVVAVVALAAVLWECWEFWHDLVYGTQFQPSNFDTMKDLVMGLSGGTIVATVGIAREKF